MRLSGVAAAALIAGGCGGSDEKAAGVKLSPWKLSAPYLPPPDPSAYARRAAEPGPARTDGEQETATGGAPSDDEVRQQLERAFGDEGGADVGRAAIDAGGLAVIPETAPPKLVALMHAANDVARKPYVYGGGHGRDTNEIWRDSAYDCSGSVSYALAAAGYLDGPMASGPMMKWGKPGPGKWVTIFANEGHAFMVVAGLRFDTSGRQKSGTRWQAAGARSYAGFVVRHPQGL
ncbi:MAG: hypothetical protein V9E83_12330 [Baekduia sp.]